MNLGSNMKASCQAGHTSVPPEFLVCKRYKKAADNFHIDVQNKTSLQEKANIKIEKFIPYYTVPGLSASTH